VRSLRAHLTASVIAVALGGCASPPKKAGIAVPPTISTGSPATTNYREVSKRILDASLADDGAWQKLSHLTQKIGNRLSGSPALEHAVGWTRDTFAAERHENVSLEKVAVPHWVRGVESAELVAPSAGKLDVLALGGSIGTPSTGITTEVLVAASFDELEKLGDKVKGKIVLFNYVMASAGIPGMNYGAAMPYRLTGATRASVLGAVAVLVRSLTTSTVGGPHTGAMHYGDATTAKIPAAALAIADADRIAQMVAGGQAVRVHLSLGANYLPDAESANVIAEIRGREKPDEIVLIGGHLDSWDVGQGAQDDGAECAVVMEAMTLLRRFGLVPRRTLRAVLFTNEENGGRGSKQYATDHQSELVRHVAAIESDNGAGSISGLMTNGVPCWTADARALAELALPAGANAVVAAYPGQDIQGLKTAGVPLLGFLTNMDHYFDVHHSSADTLDRVKPENLQRWLAALATTAFILADRQETWSCKDEAPSVLPAKP